jgi:hypothetical protein
MFDIAGWNVSLRARPNLLLNLRNYSEYIYDITGLELRLSTPKDADLYISDRRKGDGWLFLDTDFFSPLKKAPDSISLPFFMHPDVYHTRLHLDLPEFGERADRPIRVFLGGNLSDVYRTRAMERFDLVNRSEVARIVLEAFEAGADHFEIKTPEGADAVLAGTARHPSVLMRTSMVPPRTWMSLLSASDFFIASPGVIMPFSHNIIEAMAVGTIPITQYGHFFDPPLVDGSTCLKFSDAASLRERITELTLMKDGEIEELRQNVKAYYDRYLAPRSTVERIVNHSDPLGRIYLIAGHVSLTEPKRS